VEELILAKNRLKELPQGIAVLRHLKHLDISENPLQYVYNYQQSFTQVVYNLTSLQRLFLSNTPLTTLEYLYGFLVPPGTESYTARIHLIELDVSFCALTTLSDVSSVEIFSEQTSLQSVNLSGNNISTIPPYLFDDLSDLRHLNISFLNLVDGPKLLLAANIILESIDISHNKLTDPGSILASGVVFSLNISFNRIQQWQASDLFTCKTDHFNPTICFNSSEIPPDHFSSCNIEIKRVWVKYVNLSHNALTTVSAQMGASLNRLAQVDLGSNPFTCNNCTLIEFKKWLLALEHKNVTSTEYLTLGTKKMLTCTEPFYLKGSFVRDVDFNPKFCVRETDKDWLIHLIVFSTIIIIVIIISVTMYIYRYEVTYLCHLIKIMRKRRANGTSSLEDFEYDAFVCYRYTKHPVTFLWHFSNKLAVSSKSISFNSHIAILPFRVVRPALFF
jgi:Leucine-rich repeat (LRR) protein